MVCRAVRGCGGEWGGQAGLGVRGDGGQGWGPRHLGASWTGRVLRNTSGGVLLGATQQSWVPPAPAA